MDARERLRAYLEQRRELGESEFVLDGMSVEDALGAIDKLRTAHPARPKSVSAAPPIAKAVARAQHQPPPIAPAPERSIVSERVAKVHVDIKPEPVEATESMEAEVEAADVATKARVQGLVIGNSDRTLFEHNPFQGVQSLALLAALIDDCTSCELCKTAKHAVPGEGDPEADFMCVGEAPGANEDETGRPFVGQAGGLLTKILAAINLTREQVFITNVLKHRPPANRNPQPNEVEACRPYLVRQIQMVKPKVILALGTFAAQTLLETKTPIGKLRGAVHRYYGIPLIVTYHPAALLRNPAWKRPTWEDVKLARHILDTSKS